MKHQRTNSNNQQFLQTPPQSMFNSQIWQCQIHENEPITNICISESCFVPLCPECIVHHAEQHQKQNNHPVLKSIKSCKQACHQKITILQQIIMNTHCNDVSRVIQQEKNQIINLVEKKFAQMEHDLIQKQEIKRTQETSQMQEELYNWKDQLESPQFKEIIEKVINFDQVAFTESLKERLSKVSLEIFQNPARMSNLEKEVDNYINSSQSLQTNQNNLKKQFSNKRNNSQSMFQPFESKEKNQQQINQDFSNNYQPQPKILQQNFQPPQPQNNSLVQMVNGNQIQNQNILNLQAQKVQNNEIIPDTQIMTPETNQKISDLNSYVQNRSNQSNFNNESLNIQQKNYFQGNLQYLHFFPNCQKTLFLYDLKNQNDYKFKEIQLNINFNLATFHKSIVTPKGEIYVIGGTIQQTNQKSNQTFLLDLKQKTLIPLASMIQGRSSFAIAWQNDYIYVIGGFVQGQIFTNACERYNTLINQWQRIAPLNYTAVSACICTFNNYLYKFGGLINGENINHYVERYDIQKNIWSVINVELDSKLKPTLFSTSCSIQINSKEILIFGGYNHENEPTDIAYILDTQTNLVRTNENIRLPIAEGFWNNTPIIQNNQIYSLQNIANQANDDCLENIRKILAYEQSWIQLN